MLKLLGLAWTTWKLTAKRLGPAGATFLALAVVGGYLLLSEYLEKNNPKLNEALEQAV